jgi:hypothetical protein
MRENEDNVCAPHMSQQLTTERMTVDRQILCEENVSGNDLCV